MGKKILYTGVCERCKKLYTDIPESKTNRQIHGDYIFISCTVPVGTNSITGDPRYCGGFVELKPQTTDTTDNTDTTDVEDTEND